MKTPIQFQSHDTEDARLEKLKRLSTQVAEFSKDAELAELRRLIVNLAARVVALETP